MDFTDYTSVEELNKLVHNYVGDIAPWYSNQRKPELSPEELVKQWENVFGALDSEQVQKEIERIEVESKKIQVDPDVGFIRAI